MFQQITVAGTAIGLDITIPGHSFNKAVISVENANVRVRLDGTDPTTTVGLRLKTDTVFSLENRNEINNFRVISEGGAAILNILFL